MILLLMRYSFRCPTCDTYIDDSCLAQVKDKFNESFCLVCPDCGEIVLDINGTISDEEA